MLFKDVNVPEELIAANRDGKLVVFAGAGISMAPPSGLPDFDRLADAVAEKVLGRGPDEPVDRFLGRLAQREVDVQSRVRKVIGNPLSQPSPLHKALCNLPGSVENLRIVTTNFDTHLTSTAIARYGSAIDVFNAPALPLGREFRGVVNLHGSIARPEPLIITDADFGRAYLADGWATRFLLDMFKAFTVLFVGYSHKDAVMQYLARGFVNAAARFALAPASENDHWVYLGITPVNFPLRASPDEYGAVRDSLEAWAYYAGMGLLDHEQRIQRAIANAPPIDPDAIDYLDSILQDPVTLRLFTKHATSLEWLDWVERRGVLTPLFAPDVGQAKCVDALAEWFATHFAVQHVKRALEILEHNGLGIGGPLWFAVGRVLAFANPRPSAEILDRWVLVLTQKALPSWRAVFLDELLAGGRSVEELDSQLLLFQYLARPYMAFDRLASVWKDDTGRLRLHVEIAIRGDAYDLRRAWKDFFILHMPQAHQHLAPMLTGFLEEAHRILVTAGSSDQIWDPMSFRRSAIEPHGQDAHPDPWEILVDAARDVLEWMITNVPDLGAGLVSQWSSAEAPLLRRLAVHGVSVDARLTADEKVLRVRDRNWLHSFAVKHEVFHLLERAFAEASPDAQRAFVEYASSVSVAPEVRDGEARRIEDYEKYNLGAWLHTVAPQSQIATTYFTTLQAAHEDFAPRDHPDFDSWMGPVEYISPKSPIPVSDLLNRAASDLVPELLTYSSVGSLPGQPDRDGLLGAVREATVQSLPWSLQVAGELIRLRDLKSDVWPALMGGWRDGQLQIPQWRAVLELLSKNPGLDVQDRPIVDLLERAADEKGEGADSLVPLIESVVDRLLLANDSDSAIIGGTAPDWLTRAINQSGGRLTLVLLKVIPKGRDSTTRILPDLYKVRLEAILSARDNNGTFGRVVIASQANYLLALDKEWTEKHVIPLFDWDGDPAIAAQAWAGFAGWGQWSGALFDLMLPATRKMFRHLGHELKEERDHLCTRLAGVAVYSQSDPWHGGWLRDFVREADPASVSAWAADVTHALDELPEEGESRVWNGWMRDYWTERLDGIPRPLSDDEIEHMLSWGPGLPSEFGGFVELCERTRVPEELDQFVLYRLDDSGLAKAHPTATARLLKHLLHSVKTLQFGCDHLFNLGKTCGEGGAARADLLVVCEGMVRLGCPQAMDLRRLIEDRAEPGT